MAVWEWRRFGGAEGECPYCDQWRLHIHSFDSEGKLGVVMRTLDEEVDNVPVVE